MALMRGLGNHAQRLEFFDLGWAKARFLQDLLCVFTHAGCCVQGKILTLETNGRANHFGASAVGVLVVTQGCSLLEKLAIERLSNVIDRRGRYRSTKNTHPLRGRFFHQLMVKHLRDGIAVFESGLEIIEPWIGGPLGMAQGLGQDAPKLLLVAHQKDPAVLGSVQLTGGEAGVGRARRASCLDGFVQIPGPWIIEIVQSHIKK